MEPITGNKHIVTKKNPNGMRFAWQRDRVVDAHMVSESNDPTSSEPYECTTCSQRHKVVLCKASHHRYNVPAWFRHESDNYGPRNTENACNESDTHWHAKYLLQSRAGRYYFDIMDCDTCKNFTRVFTKNCDVTVEKSIDQYRCDAVLNEAMTQRFHFTNKRRYAIQSIRKDVVMEVYHKHATGWEKQYYLKSLNYKFAEFKAQDIIDKLESPTENFVKLENLNPETVCDVCMMFWAHDMHTAIDYVEYWETQYECYGFMVYTRLWKERQLRLRKAILDFRTIYNWHDWHEIITYETYLNNESYHFYLKLHEQRRQINKKRLLRSAFDDARERDEFNQFTPRKKPKWEHGEMFKCVECDSWERKDGKKTFFIEDDDTITASTFYRYARKWVEWCKDPMDDFRPKKGIIFCERCIISCKNCKNAMPLSCALRFGLCHFCNNNL